ncbi:hypothetical protein QRX60_34805 [Amycolatopsis mongoliensis]|uniref:Secreted protein n=1 Tax=Amycolatopsis mongoliensis TaxID=715475 RepID=A0A9Y2JKM1_9PSEU|nr:hypothetical protein [Amycolatopsis sp. 4-36]WIX99195.1 hypothetical protein QRX60_34805 [Amycolatopsis sp. 4-36]
MHIGRLGAALGVALLAGVALTAPADAAPGRTLVVAPDGHGTACAQHRPCTLESASRLLAREHGYASPSSCAAAPTA